MCDGTVEPEAWEKRAAKGEAAEDRGFLLMWFKEERGVVADDGEVTGDVTGLLTADTTSVVCERTSAWWCGR